MRRRRSRAIHRMPAPTGASAIFSVRVRMFGLRSSAINVRWRSTKGFGIPRSSSRNCMWHAARSRRPIALTAACLPARRTTIGWRVRRGLLQIHTGAGTLETLERELLPLALSRPGRPSIGDWRSRCMVR
jgi:hypothetical protein